MKNQTGFFSQDKIDINGIMIAPIDLTSRLLFPIWKYSKGEADITVMQVTVEGVKDGKKLRYTYDLIDRYNKATETLSMARTTGYTATMAVRLLANGMYSQRGLIVPELLGKKPDCVKYILNGLRDRGVVYKEKIEEIK